MIFENISNTKKKKMNILDIFILYIFNINNNILNI